MDTYEALTRRPSEHGSLCHVGVLHTSVAETAEDLYLASVVKALQTKGHPISLYTSCLHHPDNALTTMGVEMDHPDFHIFYSVWWLPRGLGKSLRFFFYRLRSLLMALRMVILAPKKRPSVVILDTDAIALFVLRWIGFYRTVYIHHFPQLHCVDSYHCSMRLTADLMTAKCLALANEVIVQTKCLEDILRRSYPNFVMSVTVLPMCCDVGYWTAEPIDVHHIVPDLPNDYILFVIFGEYRKRTNLKLALEAMDHLHGILDPELMQRVHVVVAGHCSAKSIDQNLFYGDLVRRTKNKPWASNVTFLKQLPTVHKKTLIEACTAVVHPTRHDIYEGPVLAAMSMAKPVLAVDCGFASEVLTHRLTGILVEPDALKFARVMSKLANSPTLQTYLGDMARANYTGQYSFDKFAAKLERVIERAIHNPKK